MTTVEEKLTATDTPSVTTWTRLEPRTRRANLAPAVDARVADPLWLLARQWQLGEFTGEDAGSPVSARVHARAARFTRYQPGPYAGAVRLPTGVPWEAVVEREPAATAGDLRFAVESGQQLLRLLAAAGAGELAPRLCDRYPVPATPPDAASAADPETVGYLRIAAGRVPHGDLALRACAEGRFVTEAQVPAALLTAVNGAITEWLTWLGVPPRPPAHRRATSCNCRRCWRPARPGPPRRRGRRPTSPRCSAPPAWRGRRGGGSGWSTTSPSARTTARTSWCSPPTSTTVTGWTGTTSTTSRAARWRPGRGSRTW
ncbi:hypothetical protein [Micromonospora sp. ATA51]|uniref:hypothetical protein n=1 Tax=Micromonospora sp. ATA51 TaxID=2806098 RepID=UPI001A39A0D8|nr:hypothetical protein [Micromonospora sp. ATA51]MBM0227713.1 hypothetical protein [Micromonospora sp. ATA51]